MGEIFIDKDNAVEITELGIQLEANDDKIIVLVDAYKSGFECKACRGTGKIKSTVVEGADKDCTDCNGKGALLVVPQNAQSLPTLGTVVSLGPETDWHKYLRQKSNRNLAAIQIAGAFVQNIKISDEDLDSMFAMKERSIRIRPGAKVLFQPHVGTLVPFKGNIRLRIMRQHETLCCIYGSDIDSKDFLDFDIPLEKRY